MLVLIPFLNRPGCFIARFGMEIIEQKPWSKCRLRESIGGARTQPLQCAISSIVIKMPINVGCHKPQTSVWNPSSLEPNGDLWMLSFQCLWWMKSLSSPGQQRQPHRVPLGIARLLTIPVESVGFGLSLPIPCWFWGRMNGRVPGYLRTPMSSHRLFCKSWIELW